MAHRSIARGVALRQSGQVVEATLHAQVWSRRLSHLGLSTEVEVKKDEQKGPVNCMSLDAVEDRYLLVGAGDSSIGVYDLEDGKKDAYDPDAPAQVAALKVATKQTNLRSRGEQQGHDFAVTTVAWWPLDTGMFVSGSMDGTVKVWDTNAFLAVGTFKLGTKVYSAALSPIMSTHTLIAVASEERRVRLCDLTSGGSTHVLMGHSEAVMCAAWSPVDEFILATGSKDCSVRVWDIRRSGPTACLTSFDQHSDHSGHRQGLQQVTSELAKAHDGTVVTIAYTPDGNWLLSAGTDKRMRLWNTNSGANSMTKFMDTRNTRPLGWSIAVAQPGNASTARVFYPNGQTGDIQVFPVHGGNGRPCQILRGHLDSVYSVVFRQRRPQVISSGADSIVLVFDRSRRDQEEAQQLDVEDEGRKRRRDEGDWEARDGEEDEEEEQGAGAAREGFVPPIVNALFGPAVGGGGAGGEGLGGGRGGGAGGPFRGFGAAGRAGRRGGGAGRGSSSRARLNFAMRRGRR